MYGGFPLHGTPSHRPSDWMILRLRQLDSGGGRESTSHRWNLPRRFPGGIPKKKTKNPWSTRVAEVVLWWRIELLQMMILMIFASCKLFGVPKVSEVKNEYRVCRLDYMYWTSLQGTSLQVGSLVQRLDRLCESKSHSTSSTVWTKLWKPWHTKTLPIIAIA